MYLAFLQIHTRYIPRYRDGKDWRRIRLFVPGRVLCSDDSEPEAELDLTLSESTVLRLMA